VLAIYLKEERKNATRSAAVRLTLNPMVQVGGFRAASGFPHH